MSKKTTVKTVWTGDPKAPYIGEAWRVPGTRKWRFRIVSTNGNIVASGGGGQEYNRKRNCFHTLNRFQPVLRKIVQLPVGGILLTE